MVNQQNITLVTAIIGAVCGVSGAVLGIINTWHQMSKNHVRLKVIPKIAFMIDANHTMTFYRHNEHVSDLLRKGVPFRLCIEVINLSAFPLTISDIGFGKTEKLRHIIFRPELTTGKTWPSRLDSRESVVAYAEIGEHLDPKVMNKALAYAKTDCGITRYGTSPIFKEYVQVLHLKSETLDFNLTKEEIKYLSDIAAQEGRIYSKLLSAFSGRDTEIYREMLNKFVQMSLMREELDYWTLTAKGYAVCEDLRQKNDPKSDKI